MTAAAAEEEPPPLKVQNSPEFPTLLVRWPDVNYIIITSVRGS